MTNTENQCNNLNTDKEEIENLCNDMTTKNKIIKDLELKVLNIKNKIHDIELRKLANIENIKKNKEEDIKKIKIIEMEKFFQKIIPIVNSLEETIEILNTSKIKNQSLNQGMELTLQSLLNILYKSGVTIEGKKNETFNAKIHNAIMIKKSDNIKSDHIISVHKKGFSFNKKILRKAMVTISK